MVNNALITQVIYFSLLIISVLRVRNLHAYVFTDLRDGALFGPEASYDMPSRT